MMKTSKNSRSDENSQNSRGVSAGGPNSGGSAFDYQLFDDDCQR